MKQLFGKFACLMLLVMACCVVAPVSAMAGTGVDNFKITSGIDTRKSSEITLMLRELFPVQQKRVLNRYYCL